MNAHLAHVAIAAVTTVAALGWKIAKELGMKRLSVWRQLCRDGFPRNGNRRGTPLMASAQVVQESAAAAENLRQRHRADEDSEKNAESVAGVYRAWGLLQARGTYLRNTHKGSAGRKRMEDSRVGGWRELTRAEQQFYHTLYQHSPTVARIFESGTCFGWVYPSVASLPPLQLFMDPSQPICFLLGSFPSMGEDPGGFAAGVLGVFASGIWAQIHRSLNTMFTVVIDIFPPMSTNVPCVQDGMECKKSHHVDIIDLMSRLNHPTRDIMIHNHRALVLILAAGRYRLLQG